MVPSAYVMRTKPMTGGPQRTTRGASRRRRSGVNTRSPLMLLASAPVALPVASRTRIIYELTINLGQEAGAQLIHGHLNVVQRIAGIVPEGIHDHVPHP